MIDPITALSVAASAVSNAKQLLSAGRDATAALSKFAGSVADINYAAEKAKNPGILASFSGSAEQQAISAFAAQKKLQELRKEIESMISFLYGPKGLEEYKGTLRRVREQRKKTEYRKAEIKQAIITWTVGTIVVFSGLFGLAIVLYIIGKQQNKW
tara:strand:- start:12478 stop:12945 length:468 start_codon:yes stop_codon:yes gene_type:complete